MSVEQREGSGPGIRLNEGNLYVFILWAERGSGPLLLPALLPAVALTAGESRARPRAGNFQAGAHSAGAAGSLQTVGSLPTASGFCRVPRGFVVTTSPGRVFRCRSHLCGCSGGSGMFFGTPGTTGGRWTLEEAWQCGCCHPSARQWEGGRGSPRCPHAILAARKLRFCIDLGWWDIPWGVVSPAWRPWVAALCDLLMPLPNCLIRHFSAVWKKPVGRGLVASELLGGMLCVRRKVLGDKGWE